MAQHDSPEVFLGGVKIPAGAIAGGVLTSDALGVATWQAAAAGGGAPETIATPDTFTVAQNVQLAYGAAITVDGILQIDGVLAET